MSLGILEDLRKLINFVYSIKYPDFERYGLQTQVRRAVVSVSLNIREGNTFYGDNKKRFFRMALGSLNEVDECILISEDLGYVSKEIKEKFYILYWLCLNKLNKLIESIGGGNNSGTQELS